MVGVECDAGTADVYGAAVLACGIAPSVFGFDADAEVLACDRVGRGDGDKSDRFAADDWKFGKCADWSEAAGAVGVDLDPEVAARFDECLAARAGAAAGLVAVCDGELFGFG